MFIELHAQSAFSFLEAAEQPETLADAAARLDMPALALVDRDGVYGAPRFYRAMTRLGLRAIVGSEITLTDGARLPLLVEDQEGYQNLCRLITTVKLRGLASQKGEQLNGYASPEATTPNAAGAAASLDDIEAHASGLVCLTGTAAHHVDRLSAIFGVSGCFVEIQRHLDREEERVSQDLIAMADRRRLPLVATNQPRHCRPGGRALADVLTCIREKTDLDHAGRLLARNAERSLKPAADMRRLFAGRPDAIVNTAELATRLNFSMKDLGYRFPDYPVPAGETPLSYLRALAEQGCRDRYGSGPLASRARAQIEHELALIGRLDLAGYFLIVWDIVQYCRQHDILVQGRGSAANSAVCYCLGITAVDSVKMDLLFERFLSEARGEWPDIDLDLPSGDRREEVIQHVYRRYGVRGAGMTANVITYRGRSAAREVGKVLGLPPDLRDRIAKLVPNWGYQDPDDLLLKHLDEAGCDSRHPRVRKFAALWGMIQDLPRHLGQHSGGMVICGGRLDEVVPLEPATMPGRVVVQWDKDDCAALGIVKVDLLGLGMMALLQDAITLVRDGGGDVDLGTLPADDPAVYAGLQQADTVGLFQVESRAQMATLPRIHPERFYDLVVQVAIIRPGPIVGNMVHPYINRRRGREPVTYPHPTLEPILKRTLGVPLFQEQLLRMAMVAAGFTASEAEELRRAFGFKRSEARMAEVETKLRAGMARKGITGAAADEIAKSITSFALYGFPECVVGDTLVIDGDTGRRVKIEDVVSGAARIEYTIACDAELRLCRRRVLKATASGRRMVYRIQTALGRTVTATAEHPLLTLEGWRPVAGLRVGDHVAAARRLPRLGGARWPRHELVVLADLIAEGNLCHPSTLYFYTADPEHCMEFVDAVEQFDNTKASVARHRSCYSVHVRRLDPSRPIAVIEWAKRLGLWGIGARGKRLPAEIFELRADDLALLLGRLWQGDGTVSAARHVTYDTVSWQLAEDVQHLLLRLGIVSRIYERTHAYGGGRVSSFSVTVTGGTNLRRFSLLVARRFLDERKRAAVQAVARGWRTKARMSRDVVPVSVHSKIDEGRRQRGVTWTELGREAGLAIRELSSPSRTKRGYRRWVIRRLAQYFDSPELSRLARSDIYWDRIASIERIGERETYDLHIEGDHNFLANDLVVHNSHATSFALLAYASAYLRTHHASAFYTAILNNQPMGFYHPATLVKDGQRHGVHFRAVDVTRSDWPCTIERDSGAVRLGLRYVTGLRESAGRAIVSARAEAPFSSLDDLVRRAGLNRDEAEGLARIGALASLGFTRRAALWETARAVRPAGPLYETLEGAGRAPESSPLREMTRLERLTADYAGTGVTLGAHPMALRRAALSRLGVARATDLAARENGGEVLVAGSVIVRQRPGTAKGFVFLSLEDETGIANVIVRPPLFDRHRLVLVTEPFLLIRGTLQQQDGVTSVRAEHVAPLPRLDAIVPSHDFG